MAKRTSGTTSYLSTTAPTLSAQSAGTLAFWVRPEWSQGDGAGHNYFNCQSDTNNYLRCQKFSDNKLYFGWRSGGTTYRITVTTYTQTANAWNSYVYVWDPSRATVQELYLNGSSIGTYATLPGSGPSLGGETRFWGNLNASDAAYLAGSLAECVVCDYVWSARQIAAYAAGYAPTVMARDFSFYMSLLGGAVKQLIGAAITESNMDDYAHPRIFFPHGLAA